MANLTVNVFSGGSVVAALVAAAAGGDSIPGYTGKEFLLVKNSHATLPRTVTIDSVTPSNYATDVNVAVVVAALTEAIIKLPAPASRWKQAGGEVDFTYSDAAADLTVGAFRWPE